MAVGEGVNVEECEGFVGFEEFHGGDFTCHHELSSRWDAMAARKRRNIPLMILQKIHAAAMLKIVVVELVVWEAEAKMLLLVLTSNVNGRRELPS